MARPNMELEAISWKCQRLGVSYGKLMQQCTQQDIRQICREYEEACRIKKDRKDQKNQKNHGMLPKESESALSARRAAH